MVSVCFYLYVRSLPFRTSGINGWVGVSGFKHDLSPNTSGVGHPQKETKKKSMAQTQGVR